MKNGVADTNLETNLDAKNPIHNTQPEESIDKEKVKEEAMIKLKDNIKTNLEKYGQLIEESDFTELLPESYKKLLQDMAPYVPISDKNGENEENDEEETANLQPVKMSNQNCYFGSWNEEGEMSGKGKYYIASDNILVDGIWKKGKLITGRIILPDGVYEGQVKDNIFNGQGKMTYNETGIVYEGEWSDNKKHGNGKMTWADGSKYEGEFHEDSFNGQGKFEWANGYKYIGYFRDGVFEGQGKLQSPTGSYYEGEFKGGKYHGTGKFIWKNEVNDDGQNQQNFQELDGMLQEAVGAPERFEQKYEGNYQFGKRQGKGIFYFTPNGDETLQCEWNEGIPHGKGEYKSQDRDLIALWRNGEIVEIIKDGKKGISASVNVFGNNMDNDNLGGNNVAQSMMPGTNNLSTKNDTSKLIKDRLVKECIDYSKLLYLAIIPEDLGVNVAVGEQMVPDGSMNSLFDSVFGNTQQE